MNIRSLNIGTLILMVVLLTVSGSAQQSDNGGLAGTVSDVNGAVIPNAAITVTNLATNAKRTLTTNGDGRWTIAVLPLGNYEVVVAATGFSPAKQQTTVVTSQTT
ncbi:MAG: carboxypeptidase-like regulatory domain-containing protein, partial [Pyrinomonadaceae bacterium]